MGAAPRDSGAVAQQASLARALGVLMLLVAADLLTGAALLASEGMQARTTRGLGVLLVLASGSLLVGSDRRSTTLLSGIVVVVEHDSGSLTLQQGDGTLSRLTVNPALLHGIRCGDQMGVVEEDTVVRGLASPTTGWRWDQALEESAPRRRSVFGRGMRALKRGSAWAATRAGKAAGMKAGTGLALIGTTLLGIGATLNSDLVATRFPVATGYGTARAPVILILVLFAAGSWFLFLLITFVSQGILVQKLERLSTALAERDREVAQLKAGFFDESAETLQTLALRLEQRLCELEPLLACRLAEPAARAGPLAGPAA